jgi:hypothetical protein
MSAMRNPVDVRVVVSLDADMAAFVDSEAARYGLSRSAIVRQSIGLRKASVARSMATADELFEKGA